MDVVFFHDCHNTGFVSGTMGVVLGRLYPNDFNV